MSYPLHKSLYPCLGLVPHASPPSHPVCQECRLCYPPQRKQSLSFKLHLRLPSQQSSHDVLPLPSFSTHPSAIISLISLPSFSTCTQTLTCFTADEERVFLICEELEFRTDTTSDNEPTFVFRDLQGDVDELYEFVATGTNAPTRAFFETCMYRAMYERKYRKSADNTQDSDLQEFIWQYVRLGRCNTVSLLMD